MNIGNILKTVGTGIVKQVFPAAGAVIDVVNEFLPADKKLSDNATGSQVQEAVSSLPPDQQATILSKELDVEIEEIRSWTSVIESLAKADSSGSSTRPKIAMIMAWVVAYAVVVAISAWAIALYTGKGIDIVANSWPFITAVIATPTVLLRSYFGMRTDEKKARYEAATGRQVSGGILAGIAKVFRQ